MRLTFKQFLDEAKEKRPADKPKDDTEEMWSHWYSLSQGERKQLIKQHGNEFDAAWELFAKDKDE